MIHHLVPEEFLATVVSESLKLPAYVWRDYMEGGGAFDRSGIPGRAP